MVGTTALNLLNKIKNCRMACAGCTVKTSDGQPLGCRNNGNCSSGGCNRLNTYDWLAAMEIDDVSHFNVVEVSFKNGSRKGFYFNQPFTRAISGDLVVVETTAGNDIGKITLAGELVRIQLRKKRIHEDGFFPKVLRKANEKDLEKFEECRGLEKSTMIKARALARSLDLNMKIGDVEYQADGRKATFYYTADGRVDFRELIRHFAREFKVKIEMRQIGARQESARVGGLGPCGRELCCSTWLTAYRTVSTAAARYQNLAINQAKLSGQCGRLKCCLNYELDTYMEALSNFPEDAEKLKTKLGLAVLVKTDIFKGLMYYAYEKDNGRGRLYALDLNQVRTVRNMNLIGEFPADLADFQVLKPSDSEVAIDYEDVTGAIELPPDDNRRKSKNKNRDRSRNTDKNSQSERKVVNRAGSRTNEQPRKPANTQEDPQTENQKTTENKASGTHKSSRKQDKRNWKKGRNKKRNDK